MKRIWLIIINCIISIILTFLVFEALSWYHFGDIPTSVVLFRLIISFILLFLINSGIILIANHKKSKKN